MKDNMMNLILVDDDPDEAYILRQALKQLHGGNELIHFDSGSLLLSSLNNYKNVPSLILLDLNMPQLDGFELLKRLKTNTEFCNLPIIVYSNSNSPQDIEQSYLNGANSYVRKPQGLQETIEFLKSLIDYWQGINRT